MIEDSKAHAREEPSSGPSRRQLGRRWDEGPCDDGRARDSHAVPSPPPVTRQLAGFPFVAGFQGSRCFGVSALHCAEAIALPYHLGHPNYLTLPESPAS